jgi:hypothetical protein
MDAGAPIIVMAILGGFALVKMWDRMPNWTHGIGIAIIGVLALYGLYQSVFGFRGFSANARREQERQAKELTAKASAEASDGASSNDDDVTRS